MTRVRHGNPGDLHALEPFEPDAEPDTEPHAGADTGVAPPVQGFDLWRCEPDSSAIVLGSRQSEDIVDRDACLRAGLDLAKRRSGGGAVLVVPGDIVWIDVIASRGWLPDDVRTSMIMVGECWREALIDQAVGESGHSAIDPSELVVHRGGMVESAWSALVCFAGVGPGEVLSNGRKLVGLSQRRTRHGVRIQGLLHLRSNLQAMRSLFAVELPADDLPEPVCIPVFDAVSFTDRLAHRITERVVTDC